MRHAYLLKRLLEELPKVPKSQTFSKWIPDELSYVPKSAWLATATTLTAMMILITGVNNFQPRPTITVYAGNKAQAIPTRSAKQITVREALERADIEYTEEDLISPALDEEIDLSSTQIQVYQKRLASTAGRDSTGILSAQAALVPASEKQEAESEHEKELVEYEVVKDDTVTSIAEDFTISPDTIRWANDIEGDEAKAGTKLIILPITGFEYQIKTEDSAISLADEYNSTAEKIIVFNNAEVDGLIIGETIIIPDGVKPKPKPAPVKTPKKPTQLQPVVASTPASGRNTYAWGNCTWYAANRRAQIGRPIPNRWGNANAWGYSAAAQGYKVNHTPALGAIMVQSGAVHVTIVEKINSDGSILVSEMNWNWRLGVKSTRTIPATSVGYHSYIH